MYEAILEANKYMSANKMSIKNQMVILMSDGMQMVICHLICF